MLSLGIQCYCGEVTPGDKDRQEFRILRSLYLGAMVLEFLEGEHRSRLASVRALSL